MEENIDQRNPEESIALFDNRMSEDNVSGEGIELEEISDLPEVKSQEDAVLPPSHLPTVGKFRRMAIILDYFSFHILIHLTLIGLDSYIAYWLILSTFSNESTHFTAPTDWYVCTIAFIVIPHILKSLFTLLSQKWPKIGLKDLKTLSQCSKIKNILFVPLWNFEWKAIFEALPLVHIVKRCISFYSLIISPERMKSILEEREKENLYCVSLHSGTQMTLQFAIGFQLGKFSEVQMISLILHSIYIVHSGSSFFFTQRRVSVPSFHSMRERFWVFCILACIFVPKIMSFGLLFSYARTFLTVAFIVLFGIGTMALFYDQLVPEEPNMDQVLHGFVSVWLPCIPGSKNNYLLKNSIATVAFHLMCHTILLIQIFSLQVTAVRFLPLSFHCFPPDYGTEPYLKGYYCPVENRSAILFGDSKCSEDLKTETNEVFARICPKGEFEHDKLLLHVLPTMMAMGVSLIFSFVLAKISSKNAKTTSKQ